jgi:hypothetical protein
MRVCEKANEPSDLRAFYLRTRDDLGATKVQGNGGDRGDANKTRGHCMQIKVFNLREKEL